MKKLICLLFIAHCSLQVVNAQQPTEEWVRRYSDTSVNSYSGSSVKMDNSGNVYVLARTGNFGFLKYDQSGNLLLTASTPVPSGFENGSGKYFDVTETGDVYVTKEKLILVLIPGFIHVNLTHRVLFCGVKSQP